MEMDVKNHEYCYTGMPEKDKSILEYNHRKVYEKSIFIIYADTESLLEKIDTYHSNPENSSTTKINKHISFYFSLFMHCSFDTTNNKRDYYKGKDYM